MIVGENIWKKININLKITNINSKHLGLFIEKKSLKKY